MGFCRKWINWILLCVTTVPYEICFNHYSIGPIAPQRGLRQGDPLSPYLFLLCVDGLSHSLHLAAENGVIHGCKVSPTAPVITHLLFADDSFLFFKANKEETKAIKDLLNKYELNSGQSVNYQKSGVFFSSNVRLDKQRELVEMLGVSKATDDSRYLGLPSLIGRSKKRVFGFVKDKVWQRIQGWRAKLISKAGKLVLLKNVAQSIPSYCISCFLLPKSLCTEIERMMNNYWWSSGNDNRKGIKWVSWEGLSRPKCKGGLGVRSLHGFNIALLGKHCWKFVNQPQALVSRVYKARYFADTNLLRAQKGTGSSFIWTGLYAAKEELKQGFRWVIGNGEDVAAIQDPWLRKKSDFRVEHSHVYEGRSEKVSSLFMSGTKQWDTELIRRNFLEVDAQAILAVQIPQGEVKDRVAWTLSATGQYDVKTGYRMWADQQRSHTEVILSVGWSKLWQVSIPHKIRVFLLRFCRDNIPVRNKLKHKGVSLPILCPMCNGDVEHLLHVFFDCQFASQC